MKVQYVWLIFSLSIQKIRFFEQLLLYFEIYIYQTDISMETSVKNIRSGVQSSTPFHLLQKSHMNPFEENKGQENSKAKMQKNKFFQTQPNGLIIKKRQRDKKTLKQLKKKKSSTQRKLGSLQQDEKNHKNMQVTKVINIRKLILLFFQKLSYNNIFRKPIEFDPLQNINFENDNLICYFSSKIQIPTVVQTIIHAIQLFYAILYIFILPLLFIFKDINQSQLVLGIKCIGVLLSAFDLLESFQNPINNNHQNMTKVLFDSLIKGQKKKILKCLIVFICTIMSILTTSVNNQLSSVFFLFISVNVVKYFSSLAILQQELFTATHYESYWKICKVFTLNLIVGHIIACILISIAQINPSDNWMMIKQINRTQWYEQYIWSYYFGTTIILTIGFGDLHANTSLEALFIIFISFFSCVFFGYNINNIGNLINNIRQEQLQKNNKLKVVNSLAKKSQLSKDTLSEITNYIIQQSKIKKQFNQAEEKKIIQQLPPSLKSSFLQEVNYKLFNQLKTIVNFTNKTIENLSMNIEAKICHPNQVIKKISHEPNLIILEFGQIGLIARKDNSKLNKCIIQRISIASSQKSKLICTDILSQRNIKYEITSLTYSAINQISKQKFQECLKLQNKDYQLYREVLDKCKFILDEFQLVYCKFCQHKKHTLFDCPKLHFQPLKSHVPTKRQDLIKDSAKQDRVKFERTKEYNFIQYINASQFFGESDLKESSIQLSSLESSQPYEKQIKTYMRDKRNASIQKNNNKKARSHKNISDEHCKSSKTIEMITQLRLDLEKMKQDASVAKFQFFLWENADLDLAYNFSHYFPKRNPDNLKNLMITKSVGILNAKSTRYIKMKILKNSL